MERSVTGIESAAPPQRNAPTHANRFVLEPKAFERHSPFLMLMEDWFAPPSGFPDHPHRGMETVTLVLEGAMEHRDHTGAHGVIGPGDVQWMTAGKGVVHSEMPGPQGVHSLQLWLNLPRGQKMAKARYCDQPAAKAPMVSGPGYELRVYAGRQGEAGEAHGSSYPMGLAMLTADAGAKVELQVPADERAFLYLVQGSARIGGAAVAAGQSAWFDPTGEAGLDTIVLEAAEPLKAVLYSGRPIPEPVVAYGPFVMNSMDEIRQAFADYQRGAFV